MLKSMEVKSSRGVGEAKERRWGREAPWNQSSEVDLVGKPPSLSIFWSHVDKSEGFEPQTLKSSLVSACHRRQRWLSLSLSLSKECPDLHACEILFCSHAATLWLPSLLCHVAIV